MKFIKDADIPLDKKLTVLEAVGLGVGILCSFLFHYLYAWTNKNIVVSIFCPVNESVWEHGKLLVFPYLFYTFIEFIFLKPKKALNYFAVKLFVLPAVTLTLAVIFFTYSGIIGTNILWVDILTAIALAIASYAWSYFMLSKQRSMPWPILWIILGGITLGLYILFTFVTPSINWFVSE